ncbi:MarR family winged helix-turn-helix transcriptional regulator [Mycolicibacterium tokaiense]|uniref:MarR family transcriptional regulator n=1 Tax=Mycolicibacterium tokaiense TaxID=39695 RepID=A0A378TM22_9MYCO|nr:MarR family winged helix-turn-helix transcriptional regulator [Mycolicibacterium tokaiense]BBY84245.1 MarR family transcriptional regulator [Mycolicibacterium tokaiense]STZ61247.1 MarR family transcriptional regulator [Mycolicibacterium tokaiense]
MSDLPFLSPNWQLVGPLLEYLVRRLRVASESEIDRVGLRPRHVLTLTLLRDFGERPQSELATLLRIDPTNLVGLLNELEGDGLIERRRSTQDRRKHTVVLTAAGGERLAEIEAVLRDVERDILGALSDDEHTTLYTLLLRAAGDGVSCSESAASACVVDELPEDPESSESR